jgi:site-specific recombinase
MSIQHIACRWFVPHSIRHVGKPASDMAYGVVGQGAEVGLQVFLSAVKFIALMQPFRL